MIFIKLKWLPWLLIIAGFFGLFSDDGNPLVAILVILAGAAGAYYFYGGKKSSSANSVPSLRPGKPVAPSAPMVAPPQPITVTPSNACPNCGAVLEDGMIFCSKCGTKVR